MSRKTRYKYDLVVAIVLTFLQGQVAIAETFGPSSAQSVKGEYIVKFKKTSGGAGRLSAFGSVRSLGSSVEVKSEYPESQMLYVEIKSDSAKQALQNNPDVEFIEPNYTVSLEPVSAEGSVRSQSDLISAMGTAPTFSDQYKQSGADSRARVTAAWAIQKPYNQGSKVVVAVIDSGLNTDHAVFKDSNAIWTNSAELNGRPGVDDDGNGFVDDKYGWSFVSSSPNVYDDNDHGTHVAGIVLGVGQDITAYPVRESKIKIMPLKALDANGSGSISLSVDAIYYAIRNGAKVINNSWASKYYSRALHEAYAYAYDQGVVITSAAGNYKSSNDATPMFPSSIDSPNNIAVAASDDWDNKPSYSNYGISSVSVAAPGDSILSTVSQVGCFNPGCFETMSGTSMASPFVAGLAALVFREAPQLSAHQVKTLIVSNVDRVTSWKNLVTSQGRVNVYKTINAAKSAASIAPYKPGYQPDYETYRGLASDESTQQVAGCGLVKAISKQNGSGGSGGSAGAAADLFLFFVLMGLPLLTAFVLRVQSKSKQQGCRPELTPTRVLSSF